MKIPPGGNGTKNPPVKNIYKFPTKCAIIEVVEGIGKNEATRLPYYVHGQCIFTGVAIEMPVVVRIK